MTTREVAEKKSKVYPDQGRRAIACQWFEIGAKWQRSRFDEDFAWRVFNMINDWKNGEYGEVPLKEVLNKYIYEEEK